MNTQRKTEEEEKRRIEAAVDKQELFYYFDRILSLEIPTVNNDASETILANLHVCIQGCISRTEKL